jgi:hypothetical protein
VAGRQKKRNEKHKRGIKIFRSAMGPPSRAVEDPSHKGKSETPLLKM